MVQKMSGKNRVPEHFHMVIKVCFLFGLGGIKSDGLSVSGLLQTFP